MILILARLLNFFLAQYLRSFHLRTPLQRPNQAAVVLLTIRRPLIYGMKHKSGNKNSSSGLHFGRNVDKLESEECDMCCFVICGSFVFDVLPLSLLLDLQ